MQPKKGLGKGLSALIPQGSVFTGGRTIVNIDVNKVVPNPRQPRTQFSEDTLLELAESLKSKGVAQPILVRMRKGEYELVAGERRLRAAKLAGLATIPAIIKDFSDEESFELALIENLQREDLNVMDECEAYHHLMAEFKITQQDVAKKVGKSRSAVANIMRLWDLPVEIKNSLKNGEISAGHARTLLIIEDQDRQLSIFRETLKKKLSVRDIELLVYGEPNKIDDAKPIKKRKVVIKNAELQVFIDKLSEYLGTKVVIKGNAQRGRIEIDYYSQEDLERLLETITNMKDSNNEEVMTVVK